MPVYSLYSFHRTFISGFEYLTPSGSQKNWCCLSIPGKTYYAAHKFPPKFFYYIKLVILNITFSLYLFIFELLLYNVRKHSSSKFYLSFNKLLLYFSSFLSQLSSTCPQMPSCTLFNILLIPMKNFIDCVFYHSYFLFINYIS